MTQKPVKVCVRTRPTHHFAQDNINIDQEHGTIQINSSRDIAPAPDAILNNRNNNFKFRLDHIFHNASQSEVYDLYANDIVMGVIDGINGAIMTYGQTGSGKTFTMMGDINNYEHRGLAPKSLGQIFSEVNSRIEFEFKVSCTYMEIYNEKIFDLLQDLSNPDTASDYTIVEEPGGRGVFVRGLTEVEVANENEALNLLFSGELARTTATHKLNRKSNRSHSIFTIYVQQRQRSGVSEKVTHSKLHLIDLAGSERIKKTMEGSDEDGVLKRESMNINQSLTYLEQCVIALAKKGAHVPYRQSKLTNILKDSLGANCNTCMIACIWGEVDHIEETVSTLRLASRMMRVQNETVAIVSTDPSALIKKQEKLIKALKQELLMHDALVERTGVSYEPYTPEQQAGIKQMVERYIDAQEIDEEDVLQISSFRQMLEVCKQFKKMVLLQRSELSTVREDLMAELGGTDGLRSMTAGFSNTTADFVADSKIAEGYDPNNATKVGQVGDSKGGFSLGTASAESKPSGGVEGISRYADTKTTSSQNQSLDFSSSPLSSPAKGRNTAQVDFNDEKSYSEASMLFDGQNPLFESFIRSDGESLYREFMTEKEMCRELRLKMRDCSFTINSSKDRIDELNEALKKRKDSRIKMLQESGMKQTEIEDIVDEEEFKIMKDLKEAKRSYKHSFEQRIKLKESLAQSKAVMDDKKSQLAENFGTWHSPSKSTSNRRTNEFGDFEGDQDVLDDQEAFDRLEVERVVASDPNSLAFFQAQKTRRALITQNSSSIKSMQKNKRAV